MRDENGGVFGPVTFSVLMSWVEDGRVSPASEVSCADGKWELAVRVAALEMNCVAEIEPASFYGPIHRKAMQGLIESGSIPAGACVYCKQHEQEQSAPLPLETSVSQAKYDGVLAQLATLEAQKSTGEAELRRAGRELSKLSASFQCERERANELSETAAKLQQELQTQSAEMMASLSESNKMLGKQQATIATLTGSITDLQLKTEALTLERESFAAEIAVLRKDNQELGEQLEQLKQQHQAELSEKKSASEDQINALKRECERDVSAKESACADQISVLTREREQEAEVMAAKNLQLAGLLQRLEELELTNQGLKQEFVKYEGEQSNGGSSDNIAARKLVLIKALFAEAAKVLEGVDSCSEESPVEIQDMDAIGLAEGELLEYEEVSVEELKGCKGAPGAAPANNTESRGPPVSEQNTAPIKPKTGNKWLFGSAEKRLGRSSLAELEAQAQIELQRLTASQNISTIFDRKK